MIAAGKCYEHFSGKVQLPLCTFCGKDAKEIKGNMFLLNQTEETEAPRFGCALEELNVSCSCHLARSDFEVKSLLLTSKALNCLLQPWVVVHLLSTRA